MNKHVQLPEMGNWYLMRHIGFHFHGNDKLLKKGDLVKESFLYIAFEKLSFKKIVSWLTAVDLMVNYFNEFGEKQCCSRDLCQFLPLVRSESEILLSKIWNILRIDKGAVPISKRQMMMFFSYYQLKMYFGKTNEYSTEDKISEVTQLMKYYHDGHRYNINLNPTDLGFNDMFMVLVGHVLHNAVLDTNDYSILFDALCILEYGYSNSTYNYHLKLLLLKFYRMLGAAKAAYKYYESLDIKHIQYDSLGYLVLWSLLSTGQYGIAKQLMDSTIKFFSLNYKETADQLTFAYKFGSFEKIIEIINFREKLKNSYHYSLVMVEQVILELFQTPSHKSTMQTMKLYLVHLEKDLLIDWDNLTDNRDVNIFISFDHPDRRLTQEYVDLSFRHDVTLLRIRMLMLRCITACLNVEVHLLKSTNKSSAETNINGSSNDGNGPLSLFTKVITELTDVYKTLLLDLPQEIPGDVCTGIEQSRLLIYLRCPFFLPLFIDTMMFAHAFYTQNLPDNISEQQVEDKAEALAKKFDELMQSCRAKIESELLTNKYGSQLDTLQNLAMAAEIVCIIITVCGSLHSLLKSRTAKTTTVPSNKDKKKKKTKHNATIIESIQSLVNVEPVLSLNNVEPVQSSNNVEHGQSSVNEKSEANKKLTLVKIYRYFLTIIRDYVKAWHIHLGRLETAWFNMDINGPSSKLRFSEATNILEGITQERWMELTSTVTDQILISYRNSVKQIRDLIEGKIDYISHLEL